MKALLIEDEISVRNDLKGLLKAYAQINIIGECGSISKAKTLIDTLQPELIFLDIHLEDGNAFTLLNQLDEINFKIIFTTAFDQFAIKALKLGAIDYLLKPVDPEELEIAINKVTTFGEINKVQIPSLENTNQNHKIILKNSDGIHIVDYNLINYCQSDGPYTTFFLTNNTKIVVSKSLKHYEQIIPEKMFVRCHQSYLVKISSIVKLTHNDTIVLNNNVQIPVSVRKNDSVIQSIRNANNN